LLNFLVFVAVGGLLGILQTETNTETDYLQTHVQQKQSTCLEQGIYEFDVEKETEDGKFLKHASGFSSRQTHILPAFRPACKTIKELPQILLHSRPIFLELHTFRI